MKFAITDTDIREVTLRAFEGENISPDILDDLETGFPQTHDRMPGSDAYICTEDEYKELVEFWTAEVAAMNERRTGELADYAGLQDTMILQAD